VHPIALEKALVIKFMVRILVCADHDLMRSGIKTLFERRSGWTVCAEARTGREAVDFAAALRPDVAIVDVDMPRLNGLKTSKRIRKASPHTKILILSAHCSREPVHRMVEVGMLGYVMKAAPAMDLVVGVRTVAEGKRFFSNGRTKQLLQAHKAKTNRAGAA